VRRRPDAGDEVLRGHEGLSEPLVNGIPLNDIEELLRDILQACFDDLNLRRRLLDSLPFLDSEDDPYEAKRMVAIWTDVPGPFLFRVERAGELEALRRAALVEE